MSRLILVVLVGMAAVGGAAGQTTDPNSANGTVVDSCGTLAQSGNCVVFTGAGGNYYLSDYGAYKIGDSVRVQGTIEKDCNTICKNIDGCIVGVKIYSSDVNPCGTAIPSFPGDAINSACSSLGTTTTGMLLAGMWLTRAKVKRRVGAKME